MSACRSKVKVNDPRRAAVNVGQKSREHAARVGWGGGDAEQPPRPLDTRSTPGPDNHRRPWTLAPGPLRAGSPPFVLLESALRCVSTQSSVCVTGLVVIGVGCFVMCLDA